jgi:hypothetical protein
MGAKIRLSDFDEVDGRKRAERKRGQRTADIKHTEVDREIASVFDNLANLGLRIGIVARIEQEAPAARYGTNSRNTSLECLRPRSITLMP